MLEFAFLIAFPAAMAFAGAMDLLTMTIPNRVSIALAGIFPLAAFAAGVSLDAAAFHLAAGLMVLMIGVGMFAARLIGGGDAKLMAAAALWVGFDNLLVYFTQVALLGGALAVIVLAYRRFPVAAFPTPDWALRLHKEGTGIPYGVAIAGGALWIYPHTHWFAAFTG